MDNSGTAAIPRPHYRRDTFNLTREEVGELVLEARSFVAAHGRRSETSQFATLAEADALFRLSWLLHEYRSRTGKRGRTESNTTNTAADAATEKAS